MMIIMTQSRRKLEEPQPYQKAHHDDLTTIPVHSRVNTEVKVVWTGEGSTLAALAFRVTWSMSQTSAGFGYLSPFHGTWCFLVNTRMYLDSPHPPFIIVSTVKLAKPPWNYIELSIYSSSVHQTWRKQCIHCSRSGREISKGY